jgi:hypothetical protein
MVAVQGRICLRFDDDRVKQFALKPVGAMKAKVGWLSAGSGHLVYVAMIGGNKEAMDARISLSTRVME